MALHTQMSSVRLKTMKLGQLMHLGGGKPEIGHCSHSEILLLYILKTYLNLVICGGWNVCHKLKVGHGLHFGIAIDSFISCDRNIDMHHFHIVQIDISCN